MSVADYTEGRSGNVLLVKFGGPFVDSVELDICLIDADGGVDRHRKLELFPPVREHPNEL